MEPVDHELLPEESFDELQLFRRDGDVQVEADYRLHVGIDRLTAHQAVADSVGLASSDQPIEEVGAILHHGFPEHLCLHDSSPQPQSGRAADVRPVVTVGASGGQPGLTPGGPSAGDTRERSKVWARRASRITAGGRRALRGPDSSRVGGQGDAGGWSLNVWRRAYSCLSRGAPKTGHPPAIDLGPGCAARELACRPASRQVIQRSRWAGWGRLYL